MRLTFAGALFFVAVLDQSNSVPSHVVWIFLALVTIIVDYKRLVVDHGKTTAFLDYLVMNRFCGSR